MAGPTVTTTVSPTGGAVVLNITLGSSTLNINSTNITIQRYEGSLSATPTTIYTGVYTPVYLDIGDALPNYLSFTTAYYYTVTDPTGTSTVGPIVPASQLAVFSSYLDNVFFRMFSAGIEALAVPAGYKKTRVLETMPLTMGSDGTIFPFIVMNLDLEQQEEMQIGETVLFSSTNLNIIPLNILRRYSVHILSHNAKERDFYKDACKAIFYTMMVALNQIGQGFTYDMQASNSQQSSDNLMPGFYICTLVLEFDGQFNMSVTTNYPPISFIGADVTVTSGVVAGGNLTFTT